LSLLRTLHDRILCLMGIHEWTCLAQEGIKPTQWQLDSGVEGFWIYATMFCKRCQKVSELSKRRGKSYG
jgi:hypothetical protein